MSWRHHEEVPYLHIGQLGEVGLDIKEEPLSSAVQRDPPDHENGEHDVGECSCEVDNLHKHKSAGLQVMAWPPQATQPLPNQHGARRGHDEVITI